MTPSSNGPAQRLIKSEGVEYTVRNASGGGGRDAPSYDADGSLTGVLERRTRPSIELVSSGEEVASELEIRTVDPTPQIVGQGESDYPTKLDHPSGRTYEVIATYPEDSGVLVLTVVRD
jgi:hypothetical protein